MKKVIVILAIICVFLAVTNPSMEDFSEWVSRKIEKESDSQVEAFLGNLLAKPILGYMTERRDYVLFSLYILDNVSDEKSLILGIGKQFFLIK